MLIQLPLRVIAELGPWLWMVAGLCLIALEIVVARTFALCLGLAAVFTGAMAVLSQSGVMPNVTWQTQIGVWMLLSLVCIAGIKRFQKMA